MYSIAVVISYRLGLKDGIALSKGKQLEPIKKKVEHCFNTVKNKKAENMVNKELKEQDEAIEDFILRGGISRGNN